MKYNEISDEEMLYSYFLASPSRNKTGRMEIIMTAYKYDKEFGVYRCENNKKAFDSITKYEYKRDSLFPKNNMLVFWGKMDYERAVKMFLEDKKSILKEKEETNPLTITALDREYVTWLENELVNA